MTNTTKTTVRDYRITACDTHGEKVCTDLASAILYIHVAGACEDALMAGIPCDHEAGVSCWIDDFCCLVDPDLIRFAD